MIDFQLQRVGSERFKHRASISAGRGFDILTFLEHCGYVKDFLRRICLFFLVSWDTNIIQKTEKRSKAKSSTLLRIYCGDNEDYIYDTPLKYFLPTLPDVIRQFILSYTAAMLDGKDAYRQYHIHDSKIAHFGYHIFDVIVVDARLSFGFQLSADFYQIQC